MHQVLRRASVRLSAFQHRLPPPTCVHVAQLHLLSRPPRLLPAANRMEGTPASGGGEALHELPYVAQYAKSGRAKCKKCKQAITKESLRVGSRGMLGEHETVAWQCMECWKPPKKLETMDQIEGFQLLQAADRDTIRQRVAERDSTVKISKRTRPGFGQSTLSAWAGVTPPTAAVPARMASTSTAAAAAVASASLASGTIRPDFRAFQRLCESIATKSGYLDKTAVVKAALPEWGDANLLLLVRMLLPANDPRIYNLKDKGLVKILSRVYSADQAAMSEHLDHCGDVSETAAKFCPARLASFKSEQDHAPTALLLADVDSMLDRLSTLTKEDEQVNLLSRFARDNAFQAEDMKWLCRLIKKDLKTRAKDKHVLEAVHPEAYSMFKQNSDLNALVVQILAAKKPHAAPGGAHCKTDNASIGQHLKASIALRQPIKPMLANPLKDLGSVFDKCPHGMYAEIKYDGERVQVHKDGDDFLYYSRSLKAVQEHKISAVKNYLPKACPSAQSVILDAELLMVDKKGKMLPFGTLGVHKKKGYSDATPCLIVFDLLFLNGTSLMDTPLAERRSQLEQLLTPITGRVQLSEQHRSLDIEGLEDLMQRVVDDGLEGLVLKDPRGTYEAAARRWWKVKKDYLQGGAMADSADLVVLGAYYGTGAKGGMMSVFLMGVWDEHQGVWRTVCKCGNGHDDAKLLELQDELAGNMQKIGRDYHKVPAWLDVSRGLVPDFVVRDPQESVVWEVAGAEYSHSEKHTAAGLSIRFPRVTRIRDDKDWEGATTLSHLQKLAETSQTRTSVSMKQMKQNRSAPAKENAGSDDDNGGGGGDDDDDDDDDDKPSSGGSSAAAAAAAAAPARSGTTKRSAADAAVSCTSYSASSRKQSLHASKRVRADGGGAKRSSEFLDNHDLPSTESESETDCDGDLPSLFQPVEVDSDATEQHMDVADAHAADAHAPTAAAEPLSLRSIPSGPPSFDLPPIFTGLRFREVHQSVAGCRDLMRVLVTCDADIIPAATATSRKNASLIHRVVDASAPDDTSLEGPNHLEVTVDSAWVWQCVRAGRLLAVDAV